MLTQVVIPVRYEGISIDEGFRADMIVDEMIILELKSVEEIRKVYKKQLLTYLKLTGLRLGLLLNFNTVLIKDGIVRLANGMPDA